MAEVKEQERDVSLEKPASSCNFRGENELKKSGMPLLNKGFFEVAYGQPCRTGGMADAVDSKSTILTDVPVQVRGSV